MAAIVKDLVEPVLNELDGKISGMPVDFCVHVPAHVHAMAKSRAKYLGKTSKKYVSQLILDELEPLDYKRAGEWG